MVDWKDPAVLAQCNVIFTNVSHLGIGAYLFEAFQSTGFEWSVFTGKRKFRWPMLLYFYCKWLLVCAFIGMIIAMNNKSPINCQALYSFNQFGGHSAIGGSSCLLMLRSMAIHKRSKYVTIPFFILACGHWAVLMWAVTTVEANWDPTLSICAVNGVSDQPLASVYFLTLGVDTVVLFVTMLGLNFTRGQSGLWNMIWDQGVVYFCIAVVANLVPAIVLMIDLNPVMNIIFSIPAIGLTATVACRCFVTLSEYASNGDEGTGIISTNPGTNANPWTHRLAGPTPIPAGIVRKGTHNKANSISPISPVRENTIQFTREVERTDGYGFVGGNKHGDRHHIDTIGHIMGNHDVIHLDAYSPTKTITDGSSSSDELPPFAQSGVAQEKSKKGRTRQDSIV